MSVDYLPAPPAIQPGEVAYPSPSGEPFLLGLTLLACSCTPKRADAPHVCAPRSDKERAS